MCDEKNTPDTSNKSSNNNKTNIPTQSNSRFLAKNTRNYIRIKKKRR